MSVLLSPRFPDAVSPDRWGAIVDYDDKTWRPWNPDKWVLHWGGLPVATLAAQGDPDAEAAQLRAWERYHKNTKGWLGIAYNWAIGNSGTLYRLRGDNRSGATSGDYEPDGIRENHEAVAVVFIVGAGQTVTAAAFDTFRRMYADVPELERVIGHSDVFRSSGTGTATSCPGPQITAFIANNEYDPPPGGSPMPVGYPVDENDEPNSIRFMQNLLNSAFQAGLTVDGVWGPATSAAIAEHLNIGDAPPFRGSGILRLHEWTIRELVHRYETGSGSHSHTAVTTID